jgi:hypothetical protein
MDPGEFIEREVTISGKTIRFANAFACNDVESFAHFWNRQDHVGRAVVILNARTDRPLRTRAFLRFLAQQNPLPLLFVAGDRLAAVLARQAGFDRLSVRRLRSHGEAALAEVASVTSPGGTVWGIGNYHGFGAHMTKALVGVPASC